MSRIPHLLDVAYRARIKKKQLRSCCSELSFSGFWVDNTSGVWGCILHGTIHDELVVNRSSVDERDVGIISYT